MGAPHRARPFCWLLREVQGAAEKRQDMVLHAVCHGAGMGAAVDFETVGDAIALQRVVKYPRIGLEPVLVADIDGDGDVAALIVYLLMHHGQRRIGGPARQDFGLRHAVLGGQVEIERRIFGVGRPGGG